MKKIFGIIFTIILMMVLSIIIILTEKYKTNQQENKINSREDILSQIETLAEKSDSISENNIAIILYSLIGTCKINHDSELAEICQIFFMMMKQLILEDLIDNGIIDTCGIPEYEILDTNIFLQEHQIMDIIILQNDTIPQQWIELYPNLDIEIKT